MRARRQRWWAGQPRGQAGRVLGVAVALAVLAGAVPAAGQTAPTRRIGAHEDPVVAAVRIAEATFPDGTATTAVIGRDDVFADSLAGAALAGTDGPVLFTTGGVDAPLRAEVAAELRRALGPAEGCDAGVEVHLLGGSAAVSDAAAEEIGRLGYCTERIAGPSRVETALAVAEVVLTRAPADAPVRQVLLARADEWADAATGGAYAAAAGVPIVVTDRGVLHPSVQAFLERVQPTFIELLGGTAALSVDVEAAAAAHGRVRRVSGPTREGTAVAIALGLWGIRQGPRSTRPDGVMLVNGYQPDSWAYAIAGAVPAAVERRPQLYVSAGQAGSPAAAAYAQAPTATMPLISLIALTAGLLVVGLDVDVPEEVVAEAEALAPGSAPLPTELVAADLVARVQDERDARGLPPLQVHEGMTCISQESAAGGLADHDLARCGAWDDDVASFAQFLDVGFNSQADSARIHVLGWTGEGSPLPSLALEPGFDLVGVGVACSADGRDMYVTYTFGRAEGSQAPPTGAGDAPDRTPVRDDEPGVTCDQL